MFVVTGITGKVGAAAASMLLNSGMPVRAVVRDSGKGAGWAARGCEIAVVPDAGDGDALARAVDGATGVFLMNPPEYDADPGFSGSHAVAAAARHAIERGRPGKVVMLSTIGAQVTAFNLLNWAAIFEGMLRDTGFPVAFLRAAWFMENAAWDLGAALEGRIASTLQPLDRAIDMVSVRDVGRTAAELLCETWSGVRTVELAGPRRCSPNDIAAGFADALGHPVEAVAVPRESWEGRFRAEGMRRPEARMRMIDGFNEGWIDFERDGVERRTGMVSLDTVLRGIVADRRG